MRVFPLSMSHHLIGAPPESTSGSSFASGLECKKPIANSDFHQTFSIGGMSLQLNGSFRADVHGGTELQQFVLETASPEIQVEVTWEDALVSQSGAPAFESSATWTLFSGADEFVFEFTSPLIGAAPYKTMQVDRSFSRAEITLSRTALLRYHIISAVEYPVCELLITNYLARRGLGIEVHGCGLVDSELGGLLFLGHSGAGKSTTARLWTELRSPEILSDDRIILRLHNDELWMYGTPWHGEAEFVSPRKAKLKRIFVLQHGRGNAFSPLSRGYAVGEIFARSFPPFHSSIGVERSLEFLKQLLDTVPCYEFQFLPDQTAVAAVLGFHG